MDVPAAQSLRIGDWIIHPSGQMVRNGETVRVEARTLRLLLCLAARPGEVVSIDELLDAAWAGVVVTPDSVYQAVATLRRILGDDAKQPRYIATAQRLGYRLVAPVSRVTETPLAAPDPPASDTPRPDPAARGRALRPLPAVAALCGLLGAGLWALGLGDHPQHAPVTTLARAPEIPQRSVAVLPFRDLTTQAMNAEYFADGMTEALIDKLSQIPGMRVPSPASSFYFKDKQLPVAEMAKSLGVAYVLDGSLRKSDTTLRIAARLLRADDGYVVWSNSYDRPFEHELAVQDEIAAEVAKALRASIP